MYVPITTGIYYTYEHWYMAEVWVLYLWGIQVLAVQRMAETL